MREVFSSVEEFLQFVYQWTQDQHALRVANGEDPDRCRASMTRAMDAARATSHRALIDTIAGDDSPGQAVAEVMMLYRPEVWPLSN